MDWLRRIFTWWNGYTIGTWLFTRRKGEFVGEDDQGNRYFQNADGSRRWVMYQGEAEASKVDANWHGWMHHTFDAPPPSGGLKRWIWEKPHLPNLTGTAQAYHPPGSLLRLEDGRDMAVYSDYQAWKPE